MNPPPIARPAAPPIPFDLPCFGCRYNLRTLAASAVCPECGIPIRRTLEHGWLLFADPAWLRRLRGGLSQLLLTLLVWPIGIAVIVTYAVFAAADEPDPIVMAVMTWSIGVVFIALWLFGVWRVTTPEPATNSGRGPARLGTWIRALHVLALVAFAATFYISSGFEETPSPAVIDWLRNLGPAAVTWMAYTLGFLLLLAHLRRLARRVVKPTLRKLLTFLLWGGVCFCVFGVIGGVLAVGAAYNAAVSAGAIMSSAGPSSAPSSASLTVRTVPMGASISWSTTAPTTGPAVVVMTTTMPTTAPVVVMPPRWPAVMALGVMFAAGFYLFILVWGGAWLLALISFRRILRQTIHENASATYAAWLNPNPAPKAPD